MILNIKFTNVMHDEDLRAYAEEKARACEKLLRKEDAESALCTIELEKYTHHQKGDVCRAEVTVEVGGKVYRASKEEPTIVKAVDKVKDDIMQALRVDKEKRHYSFQKGAHKVKEWLQGGEKV